MKIYILDTMIIYYYIWGYYDHLFTMIIYLL